MILCRIMQQVHRHSTENLYILYILSNVSLLITTLYNFKSIGCEIRNTIYPSALSYKQEGVSLHHFDFMPVEGSDEIGYFSWKFQLGALLM